MAGSCPQIRRRSVRSMGGHTRMPVQRTRPWLLSRRRAFSEISRAAIRRSWNHRWLRSSAAVGLLGDKAHSVVFDCAKVRALRPGFAQRVPFVRGAEQIVAAFDAHPELQDYSAELDARLDEVVARYGG